MRPIESNKKGVALIGLGCVGQGLYELIHKGSPWFQIQAIVVKDKNKKRDVPNDLIEYDLDAVLRRTDIDIVVEAIDDAEVALNAARATIRSGRPFITASKKMVAEHLVELVHLQKEFGGTAYYEAAVGAEIPIISRLDALDHGTGIVEVSGILNGTSNYILTQMRDRSIPYERALIEAQESGFAESDPRNDVDGVDAMYKISILAAHTYGRIPDIKDIFHWGIRNISQRDMDHARYRGKTLKSIARSIWDGQRVQSFVMPTFVPSSENSSEVDDEWNIVVLRKGNGIKEQYIGRGAGSIPTATALIHDLERVIATGRPYDRLPSSQVSFNGPEDFRVDVFLRTSPELIKRILPKLELRRLSFEGDQAEFEGRIPLKVLKEIDEDMRRTGSSLIQTGPGRLGDQELGIESEGSRVSVRG